MHVGPQGFEPLTNGLEVRWFTADKKSSVR